ncbi:protein SPT2 homolog [Sabethes cyaneus]|uniref:protein SPT2 homolog n=1 Tax=Sabethes cyaneus TaxID=53552 RepID=UPI00237E3DFF|nr:protein SPT2 homolog [Sabethes cyaneus]
MDFGKLLSVAQRNAATPEQKPESRYYSTKFAPPKKECNKKKLSDNIKKFLAKKEQEERERAAEEKRKREELLAKRDPKAKRKIEKMLKVIKSANKSVLEDAVDNQDTALTLQGPDQPDEDDYGYTSNVADQIYQQLMEKYKNNPEEKKFKDGEKRTMSKEDIDRAKARVKDALNKAQEEELAPKSRKRKETAGGEESTEKASSSSASGKHSSRQDRYDPDEERRKEAEAKAKEEEERRKKRAKRPAGPAPPDFATLLKLAEQKQFEPIKVETPVEKKEPDRLMTKKEKREYEERMAYLEQKKLRDRIRNDPKLSEKEKQSRLAKLNGGRPPMMGSRSILSGESTSNTSSLTVKPEPTKNVMAPNGRIPKLNSSATSAKPPPSRPVNDRQTLPQRSAPDQASKSKLEAALTAKKPSSVSQPIKEQKKPINGISHKPSPSSSSKPPVTASSRNGPSSTTTSSSSSSAAATGRSSSQQSNGQQQRARPFPPQQPAADRGQKSRPFPPPDVQRKRPSGSGGAPPPPLSKKRRPVIDSDSEYDSEMDDFIDDGDEEEDYSSHIRAIFGYDRSRYRDEDYDDRQMESSFAQQMREEQISKKIGIMEDLEDMRAEEEEKRQKALAKKKQKTKGGK